MNRREWLAAVPGLCLVPVLGADRPRRPTPTPTGRGQVAPLRATGLHSVTLAVTDVGRSLEFYQGLFGCPIQARQGSTVILGIGEGPRFLALTEAGAAPPRIDRFGIAVEGFDAERVVRALSEHGLERVSGDERTRPARLQVLATTRRGSRAVSFGDPHGLVVQLYDPSYCGGSGALGEPCGDVDPPPTGGLLRLVGLSHFTNNARDPAVANAFYERVFGMEVQAYQAAAPLLGVGPGDDFLMFIPGSVGQTPEEEARRPGRVHHVCFTVGDFSVDRVQGALEARGVRARAPGEQGSLQHWVSMRMPNRGGAEQGTPELYFSDPDGLSIQLQDPAYCGGGGRMGEICD